MPAPSRATSRVIVVPGLAVHEYAVGPVDDLRAAGYEAELLAAPAWHGVPDDVVGYGNRLAERLEREGRPVTVLVGLSAGTQAAAIAASRTSRVEQLLLVSPTIDPDKRTMHQQILVWVKGDREESGTFFGHIPDWARAGIPRILRGFASAVRLPLEEVLPQVSARLTVVHGEYDPLTSYHFAALLAGENRGRLFVAPGRSHSWPTDDGPGFLRLIDELTGAERGES
jgi:pimeloyl-ACP methyl ester carboxylesterase